ncbi:D-arabinono-1,4-lactone oxidase [Paracoccus jiaweipingae]|uniref:D-arabinono-1,4-lactone oxidase n=1 Tax=unclassified Paracoccus (in: a-proteobacteria) TaxID=2688777 RepID=UPI0037B60ED0
MTTQWRNWAGNVTGTAPRQPIASEAELADLLATTTAPVRVVGSGHSFSPLLETDDLHFALDGLDGVSAETGPDGQALVRAGTGIVLRDLTARMHALDLALSNMGDVDGQRLGGALATGTHGTGRDFGCYSAMLHDITLVDAQGQRWQTARGDAMFQALAVGLGTGAILTQAVMGAVRPYRLAKRRFAVRLGDLIDGFDDLMGAARNVEFYYITHSGAALGMESQQTDQPATERPADRDQQGLRQLRLAGRLLGRTPALRRWLLGKMLMTHTTEYFINDWHLAYPTERDGLRFVETEWHVPAEAGAQALADVISVVERDFPQVYFPMEVRSVAADDLWLSPFYQRPSVSIAVHHEAGQPCQALFDAVQAVMMRHDGRPHWGKCHGLDAAQLKPLYPRWDEAMQIRRDLDPRGRFLSPYLRRVLGL